MREKHGKRLHQLLKGKVEFILDHISDPRPILLQSSLAKANGEFALLQTLLCLFSDFFCKCAIILALFATLLLTD